MLEPFDDSIITALTWVGLAIFYTVMFYTYKSGNGTSSWTELRTVYTFDWTWISSDCSLSVGMPLLCY